tara:strand:- start:418 stop:1830 length:1413 start_codon:yes stop_codon:yes gene_type:complete
MPLKYNLEHKNLADISKLMEKIFKFPEAGKMEINWEELIKATASHKKNNLFKLNIRAFIEHHKDQFSPEACKSIYKFLFNSALQDEADYFIRTCYDIYFDDPEFQKDVGVMLLTSSPKYINPKALIHAIKLFEKNPPDNYFSISDYNLSSSQSHQIAVTNLWSSLQILSLSSKKLTRLKIEKLLQLKDKILHIPFSGILQNPRNNVQTLGYIAENSVINSITCEHLINNYAGNNNYLGEDLIDDLCKTNVFYDVLQLIKMQTGVNHLIWNCLFQSKKKTDKSLTTYWHTDAQYHKYYPKIIIYLNSQTQSEGATDFINQELSWEIAVNTGYLGLLHQRQNWPRFIQSFYKKNNVPLASQNLNFYRFSPDEPGSCITFYPGQCLHRGKNPIKDNRYVITLSLAPIPNEHDKVSIHELAIKSKEILLHKIRDTSSGKSLQIYNDYNPIWQKKRETLFSQRNIEEILKFASHL